MGAYIDQVINLVHAHGGDVLVIAGDSLMCLWEAADLLRLPTTGPYVVVAAELPAIGKLGLPAIENKLSARDIRSAWRLLPDLHIGVVHVRIRETVDTLIAVLRQAATVRVGISPPFHDLAETSEALRFARLAVTGKPPSRCRIRIRRW